MKSFKKIIVLALVFVIAATLTDIPVAAKPVAVQAATALKISQKTLTLDIGKTAKLSVPGTKKTVKWSSNNKKVATVSSKGTVKAIKAGTAKITATVAGKTLTCTVTVKKKFVNPYLKDAPFKAKDVSFNNIHIVVPEDWDLNYQIAKTGIIGALKPTDTANTSSIVIVIIPAKDAASSEALVGQYSALYNQSYFETVYTTYYGKDSFTITDLAQSDLTLPYGTAKKTSYTLTLKGVALAQQIYDFNYDNLLIEMQSSNTNGTDLSSIIEYMMNSVTVEE